MSGSALMSATYFEMYQKPDESEEKITYMKNMKEFKFAKKIEIR